jgi:hypothetical protein
MTNGMEVDGGRRAALDSKQGFSEEIRYFTVTLTLAVVLPYRFVA